MTQSDWLFQKLHFGRLKRAKRGGDRAQSPVEVIGPRGPILAGPV